MWITLLIFSCKLLFKAIGAAIVDFSALVLRDPGLTLRLKQAIIEVVFLYLCLDPLYFGLDVDLAVRQAI